MGRDGKELVKLVMGKYHWITYKETRRQAEEMSRAFRRMGLQSRVDKVAIFSETRAEWMISAYSLFMANIPIVTVYANLGDDGVIMALNETQVKVMVCSFDNLVRMKKLAPKVPSLRTLIVMKGIMGRQPSAEGLSAGETYMKPICVEM